jgi:hypothetical protein
MDVQQLCTVADGAPDGLNGGLAQLKKKPQVGLVESAGVELSRALERVVSVDCCGKFFAVAQGTIDVGSQPHEMPRSRQDAAFESHRVDLLENGEVAGDLAP